MCRYCGFIVWTAMEEKRVWIRVLKRPKKRR